MNRHQHQNGLSTVLLLLLLPPNAMLGRLGPVVRMRVIIGN
jgi:hypothetical protein